MNCSCRFRHIMNVLKIRRNDFWILINRIEASVFSAAVTLHIRYSTNRSIILYYI